VRSENSFHGILIVPHMSSVLSRSSLAPRFSYLFPPPTLLTMPAIGLDVSDASIKVVELKRTAQGLRLGKWGSFPLLPGTLQGGKIVDIQALLAELKKVRTALNFSFVHASLPEQQAYFFKTEVPPDIKFSRVRNVVEFKLEANVPIPLQDAIFDFDLIAPVRSEPHLDVGVTVYPREAIEKYTAALTQAGITPLSLEIEAHAIERAVIPTEDTGTHMIIDFGETRTGIAIVHRSMLVFTSTIEVRGRELTKAIMDTLKIDVKAAERFKNEQGLIRGGESAELSAFMVRIVTSLKEEIERHHAYWKSRGKSDAEHAGVVESIVLCGGNANLAGLPEYLSESLQIPAVRGNVWRNVFSFDEVIPEIDQAHSLSFATAVGLALRDYC
jgi:type IV pilus assembly protein PilM